MTTIISVTLTSANVLEDRNQRCTQEEEKRLQNVVDREQWAAEREQKRIGAAESRKERQRFASERAVAQDAHRQEVAQRRKERQRLAAERAGARDTQQNVSDSELKITTEERQEVEAERRRIRRATWLRDWKAREERRRKARLKAES